MSLKVGALFAGYGGIELALASVLDTEPAWFSEFDKAPSAILAHHWPDVPNYGDVTEIDWAAVEPVDIITGGSPCQDLSHAGKRAGMKAGTRSGLWASMCDAIDIIRPRLVVWENVRGALSAEADSAVEPCPFCVGDDPGVTLRALGRVLGDLAELGYDAWWYGLRAADVGAAHGRFRVFVFAAPADADLSGLEGRHSGGERGGERPAGSGGVEVVEHVPGQLTLLPTPAVNDMGAAYTPETWDAWTARMKSEHGNGNGHGKSLSIEALRLLSTPQARDGKGLPGDGFNSANLVRDISLLPTPNAAKAGSDMTLTCSGDGREVPNKLGWAVASLLPTPNVADAVKGGFEHKDGNPTLRGATEDPTREQDWAEYEPAIRRWEALTRPAPLPTEPGAKGQPRLSPAFVEWLMGLPAGHVTDPAIGISRNDQLKALGNGVVPQQCAAALRAFLADVAEVA